MQEYIEIFENDIQNCDRQKNRLSKKQETRRLYEKQVHAGFENCSVSAHGRNACIISKSGSCRNETDNEEAL